MRLRSLLVALLAVSAPVLAQQSKNCVLLGSLNQHSTYNDVWGYVAPNGDEYALLGTTGGTAIIDCTVPTTPVQRGFIPGPGSSWRDIRTYGKYAYVVTEGGAGMQIIDLTNPNSPSLVSTWGTSHWPNAHNICIDLGTGWIYVVGTPNGTIVADASTNPTNPTYVGIYGGSGRSNYFHDLCVENGIGYGSAIYNGDMKLFDVTSWPFTTLSNSRTPLAFTHNAWPNAAGTVAVTSDEKAGGVAQFWDITNKAAPVKLGSYTPNSAAIIHNCFIVGTTCHISFYTEGYRAVDISDPNNPKELGYYDTWGGASGGFNGAWGVYPFQPSGNIYISDISTGFYCVKLNKLGISHTALQSSNNETGPYPVVATVDSSAPIQSVNLVYSLNGGSPQTSTMPATGTPNEFASSIPGQPAPTRIDYHIVATNSNGSSREPASGDHTFYIGTPVTLFSDDFESGTNGWTHGMNLKQDDWQHGVPGGKGGDPAAAASGNNCWGNDLGPSGWNGIYQSNVSNWLKSPVIPVNGAKGLKLRFKRWLTVEDSTYDQARVSINNQLVWVNPTGANTVDTGWVAVEYDISTQVGNSPTIEIYFTLDTDGGTVMGGWTIDDVEIFYVSDCTPAQIYGQGTPGTGAAVPAISEQGIPSVGSTTYQVNCSNMLGGANAWLGIGLQSTNQTVLGFNLLIDPIVVTIPATASGSTGVAGAGSAGLTMSIPNTPSLDDSLLFCQWIIADFGSPGGYVAGSEGMRVKICRY